MFDTVIIIGAGLIGSSMAYDLKTKVLASKIIFIDKDKSSYPQIIAQGFEIGTYSDVAAADLVILATPVLTITEILQAISPFLTHKTIVTDVASTKAELVSAAAALLAEHFGQFVPAHPIAGKETSGFAAGESGLFTGKPVILTPVAATSLSACQKVEDLWQAIGAEVFVMTPQEHDQCFAKYSHLSHILSFLLMAQHKHEPQLPQALLPQSFLEMTRLAGSNPVMWHDICLSNKTVLLGALDTFAADLATFRTMLLTEESQDLLAFFMKQNHLKSATALQDPAQPPADQPVQG